MIAAAPPPTPDFPIRPAAPPNPHRAEAFGAAATAESGDDRLNAAAQDFEAVFLSVLLDAAWKTVPQNDVFGGGSAETTYRTLLVQEYGRLIAAANDLGIAEAIVEANVEANEANVEAKDENGDDSS